MSSRNFLQLFFVLSTAVFFTSSAAREHGQCGSRLLRDYNHFPQPQTCQPFESASNLCLRFAKYRTTRMPNFLWHSDQAEAHKELENYDKLVKTGCSRELLFFLCLYHFPLCLHDHVNPVVPCKSLCVRVRDSCSPFMEKHLNRTWPQQLACEALPAETAMCEGKVEACVSEPGPRATDSQEEPLPQGFNTAGVRLSNGDETERLHEDVSKKCSWEKETCAEQCRKISTNRRLPQEFDWVAIGKVNETRIANSCKTAWYMVTVTHVLRGNFSVGQQLRVRARRRRNCLCPMLQPSETYFLARRSSSNVLRSYCSENNRGETVCPMKHKDIAQRLPEGWPAGLKRKQFRKHLNNQDFPRWLIRVATDLREEREPTSE